MKAVLPVADSSRPTLPVETYTAQRVREFEEAEAELTAALALLSESRGEAQRGSHKLDASKPE